MKKVARKPRKMVRPEQYDTPMTWNATMVDLYNARTMEEGMMWLAASVFLGILRNAKQARAGNAESIAWLEDFWKLDNKLPMPAQADLIDQLTETLM